MVLLGIVNETSENEHRVAIVPEDVRRFLSRKIDVLIETGSGTDSSFSDEDYQNAGAEISKDRSEVLSRSDIILMLQRPDPEDLDKTRKGICIAGSIYPLRYGELVDYLAKAGITAFSLELLPRTTRAQSMDVLSSQSSVAGYRAAILGAFYSPRFMPMLTTAAGTVKPSSVLVIGAGVAGLMAIATARRLGASVTAYDVRKSAGDDVRSLGAKFLESGVDAVGAGGYARELSEDEKSRERELLERAVESSDLVITTAGVPGKRAPLIVTEKMISGMRRGSVVVDINAESGGNCELTKAGEVVDTGNVKIIGTINAPSEVPVNASQMYSRNMLSFISILLDPEGNIKDPKEDELLSACLITQNGSVVFGAETKGA